MVLASSNPTAWPLSIGVTRLLWVHLTLRPTSSPYRGFAAKDCSPQRPVGYMANGSFHDELLSVHKTQMVSLTHQMTQILKLLFIFCTFGQVAETVHAD